MSRKKWVNAVSKGDQQANPPTGELAASEEEIVLLLTGFNNFGDKIYNYLKLPLSKVQPLIQALNGGGRFEVRDFGEVVAAGLGMPTPEVKQEVESSYKMIHLPAASSS